MAPAACTFKGFGRGRACQLESHSSLRVQPAQQLFPEQLAQSLGVIRVVGAEPQGVGAAAVPMTIAVGVVGFSRGSVVVRTVYLDDHRPAVADDDEVWGAYSSVPHPDPRLRSNGECALRLGVSLETDQKVVDDQLRIAGEQKSVTLWTARPKCPVSASLVGRRAKRRVPPVQFHIGQWLGSYLDHDAEDVVPAMASEDDLQLRPDLRDDCRGIAPLKVRLDLQDGLIRRLRPVVV